VGKPEEKYHCCIRHKWTYNIKMHLKELGINVIWLCVTSDWDKRRALVNTS
jgi:hypothetical protein